MKICSIKSCGNEIYLKGHCNKHYTRLRRHGDPNITKFKNDINLTIEQRILKNIKKVECFNLESLKIHNEKDLICWEWQKGLTSHGYGKIKINKKNTSTHRISYQQFIGKIPKGKHILHKCDNPPCCNPKHLSSGTSEDNVKDKVMKDRQAKGEKNGGAKLTKKQVIEIIKLYKTGNYTQIKLARLFKIANTTTCEILNNKTWTHVGC